MISKSQTEKTPRQMVKELLDTIFEGDKITVGRGKALVLNDGSVRREIYRNDQPTGVFVDSYMVLDALDEGNLSEYVDKLAVKIL